MAVITWIKNNINGDVNLFAGRSPLVFIYQVDGWADFTKANHVQIVDGELSETTTWTAIPYKDVDVDSRQYLIDISSAVKSYFSKPEDVNALSGVLEFVENLTKEFTITVGDPDGDKLTRTFIACNSVSQVGGLEHLDDLFNNVSKRYYTPKGFHGYVYFYNDNTSNVLALSLAVYTIIFIYDTFENIPSEITGVSGTNTQLSLVGDDLHVETLTSMNPAAINIDCNNFEVHTGTKIKLTYRLTASQNLDTEIGLSFFDNTNTQLLSVGISNDLNQLLIKEITWPTSAYTYLIDKIRLFAYAPDTSLPSFDIDYLKLEVL